MSSNNIKKVYNKHWYTIKEIEDGLIKYCNNNYYKNILEIGPGIHQFPLANKFVGYNEKINNYISIDIDDEKLPFIDK